MTVLQRILDLRFRLSSQLYFVIISAVAITVFASLVGWLSFERIGDSQRRVNEVVVLGLRVAFSIAQRSAALVAAGPRLVSANTVEEIDVVAASIESEAVAFEALLVNLMDLEGSDDRTNRIYANGHQLVSNMNEIEESARALIELEAETDGLGLELVSVRRQMDSILLPWMDDQFFLLMTGYKTLGQPPVPPWDRLSEVEFNRFRHLANLLQDTKFALQLLASSSVIADPAQIEPLREQFEATTENVRRSLSALGTDKTEALELHLSRLFGLGIGLRDGFDIRAEQLGFIEKQRQLLEENHDIVIKLDSEVEELVDIANTLIDEATGASNDAVVTGRQLLLALSAMSVIGAVLIGWLLVGRLLLRRLAALSERMRAMAHGDLEGKIEIKGRDEIADMAAALEIFRRHAREVQRLNLVEKLAGELQDKNTELEKVLDDLKKVQNQIVMREKLAALGELTAGVAHEIKNPLNFVKNFAEASGELIEELEETLDESDGNLNEEDLGLVREIAGDLKSNVEKIGNHGSRADRIVHDMLRMGRGVGRATDVEINRLVDEHARLAYHGARAAVEGFRLELKMDLDPDAGSVTAIPQDLGRVVLNLVSNACYATHEKRMGKETENSEVPYEPTLNVSTRKDGEFVSIEIRDNGSGIPDDVIGKIFNPFFTTKPTDKGTGLGLALSNDIVQQHGGKISVESKSGQFTLMTVVIPVEGSAELNQEIEDEAA
ncbi:MAG: ATP-binding protein [Albidovulum sp.]|nr:ATP-binding protein [Albidovulum sp.]